MLLVCKQCGNNFENKSVKLFCSKECKSEDQRNRQTGVKRPAHSEFMKRLVASGKNLAFNQTLIKKGELRNKEVNTESFKRKRLDNNGIEYNDENLNQKYSALQNQNVNCVKSWKTKIFNAIQKYPTHQLVPYLQIASAWSDDELIKNYRTCVHGIFTTLNFEKRGKIRIPVDCSKGVILVRSSYEVNWVKFLDKNKIDWEYEPQWFRLSSGKFYLPDFKLLYNNETLWIEVKGAFWGHQSEEGYIKNIVNPFTKLVSPQKFLLTFTAFPTMEKFNTELTYA